MYKSLKLTEKKKKSYFENINYLVIVSIVVYQIQKMQLTFT